MKKSPARIGFLTVNYAFFFVYMLLCVLPLVHVLAISLSTTNAVGSGRVFLWPVDFTWQSYTHILAKTEFWHSMRWSLYRIALGVPIRLILVILAAYPLSKSKTEFRAQPVLVWVFVFTMLFYAGMIPTFMIVRYTGLINTIFALVLPNAVSVFNVVLLINFFRGIPKELEESAFIDGAGYWQTLCRIVLPVSIPILATLTIFAVVSHWNAWFDGAIYMNDAQKYPMQTYLRSVLINDKQRIVDRETAAMMRKISDRTVKSAQVFIASIPILCVYPFLQKYFITGITLGSVKE